VKGKGRKGEKCPGMNKTKSGHTSLDANAV